MRGYDNPNAEDFDIEKLPYPRFFYMFDDEEETPN